jgi:hypothetical protein
MHEERDTYFESPICEKTFTIESCLRRRIDMDQCAKGGRLRRM